MGQTPQPTDALRVGQIFLGKYRVDSILGQGGMGVVAACTHLALDERVALKMLRQDVLLDPEAVERFMREAQAAAKLKSEYVAKVRDVGTLENGTPFMVMEYLDGQDLGVLLTQRGSLPIAWASELILQTCEALAEAHSLGIVHRDVKPTNLFVTWRPDGSALIKVLDFGISKSSMGTDMQLTQTQSLLGTPAYMSPEQMRSARLVDARTDIWSLGTVLYELVEGRKPFDAASFSEMCIKVAVDPPLPMVKAPIDLQHVVLRCLAKTPEQRYPSMADLARDLVPFTQDAYQASVLVERMQRMLARSDSQWDGTTGVGLRGVPHHVRDVGSAPVRAAPMRAATPLPVVARAATPSPWSGSSDPAAPRWSGSHPAGQMFRTPVPGTLSATVPAAVPMHITAAEPSVPALAPSAVHDVPRPRRIGFVLLGVALVAITAALVAFAIGTDRSEHAPASRVEAPPVVIEAKPAVIQPNPAAIETQPAIVETKPVIVETKPAPVTKPAVVETKPAVIETKPAIVETKPAVADTVRPKTVKTSASTTAVKRVLAGKKPDPKVTKDAKAPKIVEPVVKPACNAFDHPHGCPKT